MIYAIVAALVLILDIITKIIAERSLMPVGTTPILKDIIHFTYVENRGVAFGMFSGGRTIFIIVSIIVLIILGIIVAKTNKKLRTKWMNMGAMLIFSGAIGNLADRIFRGYVVDFIDFRIIKFPVFNIADIAVCIGAAMLVIHFLIAEEKAAIKEKLTETEEDISE